MLEDLFLFNLISVLHCLFLCIGTRVAEEFRKMRADIEKMRADIAAIQAEERY